MEKAIASSYLRIDVDCPYCGEFLDMTDQLSQCLNDEDGFLRAKEIEEIVKCSKCDKEFIVEQIEY